MEGRRHCDGCSVRHILLDLWQSVRKMLLEESSLCWVTSGQKQTEPVMERKRNAYINEIKITLSWCYWWRLEEAAQCFCQLTAKRLWGSSWTPCTHTLQLTSEAREHGQSGPSPSLPENTLPNMPSSSLGPKTPPLLPSSCSPILLLLFVYHTNKAWPYHHSAFLHQYVYDTVSSYVPWEASCCTSASLCHDLD